MEIEVKTRTGHIICHTEKPYLEKSKCRNCKKEIYWVKTVNGKNMPVSIGSMNEYISHFADCPAANEFRKKQ